LKKGPRQRRFGTEEMIETVLFYVFALLTLGGALLTITRRSAVLAAVWLTVSLLGVAGLFLVLGAEFLFAAQIVLYIGGVTLLFLFVVMLVNLDAAAKVRQFRKAWPLVAIASPLLGGELIALLAKGAQYPAANASGAVAVDNPGAIADLLLSRYAVAFELASVLLLVAIVGSVRMGQQR
jgi:NADH-quinone oxidoreductase subunit J